MFGHLRGYTEEAVRKREHWRDRVFSEVREGRGKGQEL
jgi:hypothetical protein